MKLPLILLTILLAAVSAVEVAEAAKQPVCHLARVASGIRAGRIGSDSMKNLFECELVQ